MRLLFIVHGFPPWALGGTEIYTSHLARTFREVNDDEVFVLTREADPERPEYELRSERRDGVEIRSINNTFRYCRSFEDTYRNATIRALAGRILDEIQPDVVHIQHLTCLGTDLVGELALRRLPTVFTLNDYWLICQRGQLFDLDHQPCDGPHRGCRRCADAALPPDAVLRASPLGRAAVRVLPGGLGGCLRTAARRALARLPLGEGLGVRGRERVRHIRRLAQCGPLFLAPSDTLHERFLDFGFPPERLRRFEQGIETRPFTDLERTASEQLRIGFLGSLMVSKAPHVLLEAFAGLPAGRATLEIYGGHTGYHGDESYREVLEPLLAAPGVHHHGSVPNAEIPRALAAMDVLVMPSVWLENAPFVIREAFAAGVPVVASDRGGMAERIEPEKNGLLFRPGDPEDLRRQLTRLLDQPELLQKLRAGIPTPRTIEEAAAELHEIYRSLPADGPLRMAAVVLNYRTPRETLLAVRSLCSSRRPLDEILVVDNASDDGSEAFLRRELPDGVRLLTTERNLGFSGGSNAGIRAVLERGCDLVLLVNSDAMLDPDAAARLEGALLGDLEAGIAGPVVLSATDPSRVTSRGIHFSRRSGRMRHPEEGEAYEIRRPPPERRVDGVMGCAMLIRRQVFAAIGFLDEDYFFSFEDLDFCLRASGAGHASVVAGSAVVYHHGSRSIGAASPRRLYFAARNHLLLARRAAPVPPLPGALRGLLIFGFNAAFALIGAGVPRLQALAAVVRGTLDYLRRRGE